MNLFLALVALLCCCSFSFANPPPPTLGTSFTGKTAPPIVLRDLAENFVSLADYCGKKLNNPWKNKTKYTVILAFWATYCAPCRVEIPQLEKLAATYPDSVKLLLISIDKDSLNQIPAFVKKAGFQSLVLSDLYGKTAGRYGVDAVPALFLIDRDGVVRLQARGYREGTVKEVAKALKALIQPSPGP